jgi:hypothetical protein
VDGKIIEPVVWSYILNLILNAECFESALREAQELEASQMQPKQKELEHVIGLLEDTELEAEEIAQAARKVTGIVALKLEKQSDEVNRRYQALQTRKVELQEELKLELTEHNIDNLMQFREAVAFGLGDPTFTERRQWLELLQVAVTVTSQTAIITCRISSQAVSFSLNGDRDRYFAPSIYHNPGVSRTRHH